jgi:uncharacterized membrane protein YdjX (TVP38/TMEM64 family)
MQKYFRIAILFILIFVRAYFFASGVVGEFRLGQIQKHSQQLTGFVANSYPIAVLTFILVYIIIIVFSLPVTAVMTLLGGFLFQFWGIIFVGIAGTTGATINFFVARYLIGNTLQTRYAKQLKAFNTELASYQFGYAIFVRFVPVLPFSLVNILAGLTSMSPRVFIITTILGTLPATIGYIYLGQQLQSLGSLSEVVSARFLAALCVFAVLALAPLIVQKTYKKHTKN